MIFSRDCVTRENYWRITQLVSTNIAFHGSPYNNLYIPQLHDRVSLLGIGRSCKKHIH